MKLAVLITAVATIATAEAFVSPALPAFHTSLAAKSGVPPKKDAKKGPSIAGAIFGMDLWKDRKDSNDYGARGKKKLTVGKITEGKSYVPAGLTAAQYNAVRGKEKATKDKNYARNVAKAGKFEDYTDFYLKRGTDTSGSWIKDITRGHRMVKTKYDYSGKDQPNYADMKQPEGIVGKTVKKGLKKK
mmetsp:Transcript_18175/g.33787  ORF Transcript_18175/g.33787 Transcript_18175/m.33787 type:complete len:187 (-) Transcript_18175:116-676(-)|eukprot:CAMPEP_0182499970 /NCGR_PEP_ID=MMETSP1321-20130603/8052_1 /TAXON_ID=91990 /ORGANISM="Bolidomonas sp., Strain RCC1657" /LENGTH=186 /DNA_ID=CAMNT_0024704227 /DNA_START=1 /DNA_END=561 /DNA_ORIENTATION=-